MNKLLLVFVSVIFLVGTPACSLVARAQPVLEALKATPTPVMTTLGIQGSQLLQFYLEKGFQIDKNQGVVGENRLVVKSPDGAILLNISVYQGEVVNATLWIPIDPKNIQAEVNRQELTAFLDHLLPTWDGRNTWLKQTLEAAAKTFLDGSADYYTIDDAPRASVELSASTSTQQIVLLIFARQQPSY